MGVIPQTENTEGVGAGFGAIQEPIDRTGFFQNIGAGYRAAQAGPGTTRSRQNAYEVDLYNQVIDALTAEGEMGDDYLEVRPGGIGYTGPKDIPVNAYGVGRVPIKRKFRNPYTAQPSLSQNDNPLARLYLGGDTVEKQAIWAAVQRVRRRKPDFLKDLPDETALATRAVTARNRERASAEEVMARANTAGTVGGFIGGVTGSILAGDPENFVGFGISSAPAKTVARTIIKRGVTEGAVNAGVGVVALPGQVADADRLGDEMTAGDMVRSVAEQGAVGLVLGTAAASAGPLAGKAKKVGGKLVEGTVDLATKLPGTRDLVMARALATGTVKERDMLAEYRRLHNPYSISDTSTPDERAAMNVLEREVEVREASPLHPDADPEHENRLGAVADALGVKLAPAPLPSTAPVQQPTIRDRSDGPSPRRVASFAEAVHQAEGTGKNPDSSATGHFQFIDSTWLDYAPRVTDTKGMSRSKILGLRQNRSIAEAAERLFRADNARYLRARGVEDSPGNLSLAHFLGATDAAKTLRAAPDTPIERIIDPKSYRANKKVLEGKSASEVVAWAHKRIGASIDAQPARADAVPDYDIDEIDYASVRPYERRIVRPDEIETDAALMQYKSGGDEAGVTDKLKDVTSWNPTLSSEIMLWEGADGRLIVVDGHQRTGLAKRLYAEDPTIELPAIVFREADGITAAQARVLGAMRNINLGTGSLLDNARVLRDAPQGAAMLRGAENRREIEGLAGLSYEAFGAAINDVIDPRIAAEIGRHAGHAPETHMALVDLLVKSRVSNPREAATIVRQAQADGFGTPQEEQLGMFGDTPAQSLYVPIARILDAASKRLRDERRTFKTLSEKAGRIEDAGNVLDRTANQGKVISSDEALAILNATAHSSGPVRDALIAAARTELSGSRRADAVKQFLDALSGIDLRAAARGLERDGPSGEPFGGAGSEAAAEASDADVPDGSQPSLLDRALDTAARAEVFSDPVGPGAKEQTDLLTHDLRMDALQQTRTVFHGTDAVFDEFDVGRGGSNQEGFAYPMGFFTTSPAEAAVYGANVGTFENLSENPIVVQTDYPPFQEWETQKVQLLKQARDEGFDSIIIQGPESSLLVALDNDKIRRAQALTLDRVMEGQRGASLDELIGRANENQAQLAAIGDDLASEHGIEFKNPGIKETGRIRSKIENEGYADVDELKDLSRGAFIIDTPEQANALAAQLASQFQTYDKGWVELDSGYFDRKLIVAFPNGGVGEIQIVPRTVWDAKTGGLNGLYKRLRASTNALEIADLMADQQAGYAAALEGTPFAALRSSSRSASGNIDVNSASVSDRPSADALPSIPGAERQMPLDQAQPVPSPEVDQTLATGRSSTSNKSMLNEGTSEADIGQEGGIVNETGPLISPAVREELVTGAPNSELGARVDQINAVAEDDIERLLLEPVTDRASKLLTDALTVRPDLARSDILRRAAAIAAADGSEAIDRVHIAESLSYAPVFEGPRPDMGEAPPRAAFPVANLNAPDAAAEARRIAVELQRRGWLDSAGGGPDYRWGTLLTNRAGERPPKGWAALEMETPGRPVYFFNPNELRKEAEALPPLDRGAEVDPAIAERQRQEAQLKAEAPMRSVAEQESTMGLGLFDAVDQPTFRLSEEGDARSIDDILREADADEAAAKNAKDCLK
jgi:hypothetical protein